MKTEEINIRDPYILPYNGTYYMYGTRSKTCWTTAEGFDCYKSKDLSNWEGPFEIFHRPEGFWADRKFWAPECYFYNGKFFLVTTFGAENGKTGIQILHSDTPEGPFEPWTDDVVTPENWVCIDGTLYWEDGIPYLIFSHSFEDDPDGSICCLRLSEDLKKAVGTPKHITSAANAPWAKPVPFAKEEFHMEGDIYLTDGPCLIRSQSGTLFMTWSSWSDNGYAVGVAVSDNGRLDGSWTHQKETLFSRDGGHGMCFRQDGKTWFSLHYPNDKGKEHPVFYPLKETDSALLMDV